MTEYVFNADRTMLTLGSLVIPVDLENRHYQEYLDSGVVAKEWDTSAEVITAARAWRNAELLEADNAIKQLQDEGGNVTGWSVYRVLLRNWPEHKKFPSEESKPTKPV